MRWRLAAVSAGLTLVILMLFGGVIGGVATQRIRDDFNSEVRSAVQILASEFKVEYPAFGPPQAREGPRLNDFVLPDDAAARVLDINGDVRGDDHGARPGWARPSAGISDHDGIRVATEPIIDENGTTTGYVQYGRSIEHVDATIDRLWLFIAGGVLGGTLLASLRRGRDRPPGDAPDRLADRDRARDRRPPATPRGRCRSRRSKTRSANWP